LERQNPPPPCGRRFQAFATLSRSFNLIEPGAVDEGEAEGEAEGFFQNVNRAAFEFFLGKMNEVGGFIEEYEVFLKITYPAWFGASVSFLWFIFYDTFV
jgi:hypothetical protein